MYFLHADVSGEENRPVVMQEISFSPHQILRQAATQNNVFFKSVVLAQEQMNGSVRQKSEFRTQYNII